MYWLSWTCLPKPCLSRTWLLSQHASMRAAAPALPLERVRTGPHVVRVHPLILSVCPRDAPRVARVPQLFLSVCPRAASCVCKCLCMLYHITSVRLRLFYCFAIDGSSDQTSRPPHWSDAALAISATMATRIAGCDTLCQLMHPMRVLPVTWRLRLHLRLGLRPRLRLHLRLPLYVTSMLANTNKPGELQYSSTHVLPPGKTCGTNGSRCVFASWNGRL